MSNPKLKFADDITRFLQMFAGISEYAAEVGRVGSLEQAAAEAEKRIAKAQDNVKAVEASIQTAHDAFVAECQAKRQQADEDAAVVRSTADGALKAGEQTATRTIAAAKEDASRIVAAAKLQKADMEGASAAANEELVATRQKLAAAQADLDALTAELSAKQAAHDAVTAKHDTFLKSIGAK